jgi:hypothetical protein
MKTSQFLIIVLFIPVFFACEKNKNEVKGFSVSPELENQSTTGNVEQSNKYKGFKIRPSNVLLTGYPEYRLTTMYKLNYDKKNERYYIGSNNFYRNYMYEYNQPGNNWHNNFMPGLEAVYGFNFVNVSLFNNLTQEKKNFFENPVLIKTLYYPSFSKDTLNNVPVKRNYYLVSAYDEDTNGDSTINVNDLRRFYKFDLDLTNKKLLVPKNYSVISSEYDQVNDLMYVFAQLDENGNGKRDETEAIHVFWISLNNPDSTGRQY